MLTIASTTISVIIALIALREAQQANERANRADAIAQKALSTPPIINYHAPRPEPQALRLPDFIERLETRSYDN